MARTRSDPSTAACSWASPLPTWSPRSTGPTDVGRDIDIAPYPLSHLAVRVPEWDQYVHLRTVLERHAIANLENVWNGRPILLADPLRVLDGQVVPLIELMPPVHRRVYRMGLEHLGVVVGEEVDAFSRQNRAAVSGQQLVSATGRNPVPR